jgi:uncharacterized protein (DUF4415 family)
MTQEKPSKKINLGRKDLLDDSYRDPKNKKHRVTMWVDGDVLEAIKAEAAKVGAGYQTFLNKRLREIFLEKHSVSENIEEMHQGITLLSGLVMSQIVNAGEVKVSKEIREEAGKYLADISQYWIQTNKSPASQAWWAKFIYQPSTPMKKKTVGR